MVRDKIIEYFVNIDDFCKIFENEIKKHQIEDKSSIKHRNRKSGLYTSEVIALLIGFHGGQFRNFKSYYLDYVCIHLKDDFP